MLELYINALLSLPKVLWWKMKTFGKCQIPWIQSFDRSTRLYLLDGKASFGKETVTRRNNTFRVEGGRLTIGDKCFFNEGVSITCKESIRIGDRTQIGNNVVMVDHDHANHRKWDEYKTEPIVIGNNVWIGANSVILRGSKIGDNSIIGAGCIIKGEIPENSKVMQNRQIVILKKC